MKKIIIVALCTLVVSYTFSASACEQRDLPLIEAAKSGDVKKLTELLACSTIDVNEASNCGLTPLHLAAAYGHHKVARVLIAHPKFDVNKTDSNGCTPLYKAAFLCHQEVVQMLIAHPKCDVNKADNDGITPLHWAAYKGHLPIVKDLLAASAHVNEKDNNGWTPLHLAATEGYLPVVQVLLAAGTDESIVDNHGQTALQTAIAYSSHYVADLLRRWPTELQPNFMRGLRISCLTFLALLHPRCGYNSAANILLPDVMRYICSYLSPHASMYSWAEVEKYIAIAKLHQQKQLATALAAAARTTTTAATTKLWGAQ